ncbi:MAG: hypothetical protein IJE68_03300 [Clostridia bacterium]|nr:hypothetical protein [Clostridia bacterium]
MKSLVQSIEEQISTDKEVITVLPRNGIKSIKTLLETIQEMTQKYEDVNKKLLEEIETRFNELTVVEENEELPKLEQEILKLDCAIKNTDTRSSYEKMRLDKIVYNVNGYYKSNLERLNKELVDCVKQFEAVGIRISANDFNISEYAKEYMTALLQEVYNGEINSEKIKDTFEKVYWKCSEVVSHLYVNIRYIYDKYENEIDKFYENKTTEILQGLNATQEQVEETKIALIRRKKKIEDVDDKIILGKFYNGALNINDYREENYKKIYLELISKDVSELSEKEKNETDESIEKLNDNLNEYFKFNEYKFLSDGVLNIREEELKRLEKENGKKAKKTEYDIIKENIKKLTVEIFKTNDKLNKPAKGLFGRKVDNSKKNNNVILQRNNSILELKKLYMQLDDEIIKKKIMENIDETSSILDVLKLGSYYYGFMAKEIIKKNLEITDKELGEMAQNIRDFITFSNFTVINYIKISDKKELSVIIKDKYQLFGMKLSKENFQEGNLEDLIKKVKILNNYNNILKSKFSINDLSYIMTVKEMLKK